MSKGKYKDSEKSPEFIRKRDMKRARENRRYARKKAEAEWLNKVRDIVYHKPWVRG